MEKLDEVLNLLKTATPMLQEFIDWKKQEAEREAAYQQEQTESQEDKPEEETAPDDKE